MQRYIAVLCLLLAVVCCGAGTTGAAASRLHWRHLHGAANCLAEATATPLTEDHLQQLKQGSRRVPASHSTPASDWPEGRQANEQDALQNYRQCIAPGQLIKSTWGFRYKVINRTVLVEPGHDMNCPPSGYRDAVNDMLRIATWLYEDFSDVDLFFNFADTPTGCPLDIPWLQYAVLQPPGYKAPEGADAATAAADYDKHLQEYVIEEYLPEYKADPNRNPQVNGTGYTRGYTIPLAHAWPHLALSEEQLKVFVECHRKAAPWSSKVNDVFWRGSTTGRSRGWHNTAWQAWKQRVNGSPNFLQQAVMNKRSFLALMSYPYRPELNIALSSFYHEEIGPLNSMDDRIGARLLQLLIGGSGAPMHDWVTHKFTVSIDGHGPPFRLPMQLLSGTAMLMMDTPYRTEFAPAFEPHKHYIPFAYDYRDWLQVALSSVQQAQKDSTPFQRMAEAAASVAASRFSLLGQLDTLMTSIMGVKRHSPWQVTLGKGGAESWQPLPAQNPLSWGPAGLSADVVQQICQFNAEKQQAFARATSLPINDQ